MVCVFRGHSSCHGESEEGDRVVLGAAETQKVTSLAFNPGPASVPLTSWIHLRLELKKMLPSPRSSQGQ